MSNRNPIKSAETGRFVQSPELIVVLRFCRYCGEVKPTGSQYKKCIDCRKEDARRWGRTERAKAIWRKYAKTTKGLAAQERRTFKKHGITPEQYYALLEEQNRCCAICGSPQAYSKTKRKFAIDHNHSWCPKAKSCGKCVRGLLCNRCNAALERLESIQDWAQKATAYLTKFQKRTA